MGMAHGITMLGWSDYVGLIRCRAVPSHRLESCLEHGLGWAVAGQALTPFSEIAPNPWGPSTEVRQVPDPTAHVNLPAFDGRAPFDLYLCDSRNPDGSPWECCTRDFARRALAALEAEFGPPPPPPSRPRRPSRWRPCGWHRASRPISPMPSTRQA